MLVHTSHGIRLVPELYAIPSEAVDAELADPGSQEYVATGRIPFMWAQSLYVISKLLKDSFIACGELDPINRRLSSLQRPEVIVHTMSCSARADVHLHSSRRGVDPVEKGPLEVP